MSIHTAEIGSEINTTDVYSSSASGTRSSLEYSFGNTPQSDNDQVSNVTIKVPEIRALKDNGLTPDRLEIISTIDFVPINLLVTGSPNKINILYQRLLEQQISISKLVSDLGRLKSQFADEYAAAENQYRSVLAATEADINIFKLLLLIKEYGIKAPRFLEFMEQYEYSDLTSISFLGLDNLSRIEGLLGMLNLEEFEDNAISIFMHAFAALNFAINYGNPRARGYTIERNELLRVVASDPTQQLITSTTSLSRNLSFSNECVKIREDDDGNKRLKGIIEEVYGSEFLTSKTKKPFRLAEFSGIPSFALPAQAGGNPFPEAGYQGQVYNIESLLRDGDEPVITTLQARGKSVLLPESGNSQYGNRTYGTIEEIINSAFSAETNIDLTEYDDATQKFVSSIKNVVDFNSISFKVGEYAIPDGRTATVLGSNVPSLTPGDVATTILEVFNRRFAAVANDRLTTIFRDFGTEDHVNYARIFSYVLLRENPGLCKNIFNAFIDDFDSGFLTAKSLPEEDQSAVNVLPGTDKIVDLSGLTTQLGKKIGSLVNYYASLPTEPLGNSLVGATTSAEHANSVSALFPEIGLFSPSSNDALPETYTPATEPDNVVYVGSIEYTGIVDNRVIIPMSANVLDNGDREVNHLTVKMIAAEIIDIVLEVIRNLLPIGISVEPSGDDPIFPSLTDIKSPYGAGKMNFTSGIYQTFATDLWVNTISTWNQVFTREGDKTTYYSSETIRDTGSRIVEILKGLMSNYDFLSVRKSFDATINYDLVVASKHGVTRPRDLELLTCGLVMTNYESSISTISYSGYTNFLISEFTKFIQEILDSTNFDSISNSSIRVDSRSTSAFAPSILNRLAYFSDNIKSYAERSYRSGLVLDYFNNMFDSYSTKIEDYRNAITTIIESDESPIQETISNLIGEGNSGIDVLQNITSAQLVLKEIALEQETANESSAFIPQYSIVDSGKFNAMSALLNHKNFLFPESGTTKVTMVGIPATSLALHKESESVLAQQVYSIKIGYTDSEYPQLVFKPKTYNFARNYYILPGGFSNITEGMSIEDILSLTNIQEILTQYQFRIIESAGTDASLSLQKIKSPLSGEAAFRNSVSYPHLYDNIILSELLKEYYQLMAGLNFNESAFPTTPSGVNLQISEAAFNLADSLATVIDSVSSFPESIATSIRETAEIGQDLSKINELIAGELTSVDASLIEGVRSAYQTRLFSPEVVRSSSLSAKTFDRVLAIPVDPDEFFVETEGDLGTPQEIIDAYLSRGVIEEVAGGLKLKPRNYAEGTMAFGSFTVSLGPGVDNGDSLLGE